MNEESVKFAGMMKGAPGDKKTVQQAQAALAAHSPPEREDVDRAASLALESAEAAPAIVALLAPHLDVAGAKCVLALERIPLPPPHSPEEKALKSALGALMQRLWTRPIAHPAEVARLTEACIAHFQTRFLGADTFVFGQFIHTNVVLGKGAEGTVYLGFQLPSLGGQPVAIKKIDKTALLRSAAFEESLDRQCEFLSKTDHPSIVKLYAVEKLESCWYCYYEFLDGGDLDSFLTKRDATPQPGKGSKVNKIKVILSEAKAKEIFRKLVRPVDYLRQNAVIHRDLKPHNFMLTRAGEVKLVDFATMREAMDVGDMAQSIKGTPAYMAPEIWNRERRYEGEKVDVWSMGVILYEMVCGALPWQGDTIPDHLKNVRSRPLAIPASLGLSKELCELLTNVLKVNSDVRMSWAELISHDWLVEDPLSSHVVGNFLEERAAQLELELERLKAKCKVLSTGSEQKDLVIQNLSHQLKEDAEKQEEKDRMIQSLSRELQEEKEARQRDRESASGNEAQVKQAADQLEAFRAEAAAKEAALKDKVLMSTQQVVQLRERIDLAEKEKNEAVDAIRRQLTEALASNHDLSSQLGELKSSNVKAEQTMQAIQARVQQLNDRSRTLQEHERELEIELRQVRQELVEKDHMLEDVMGNLAKSGEGQHQVEELSAEVERLQKRVRELEESNASLDLIIKERFHWTEGGNDNNA